MPSTYDTLSTGDRRALRVLLTDWTTAEQVTRALGLPSSSVRRLLDLMVRDGLAERRPGPRGRGRRPWAYRLRHERCPHCGGLLH